MQNNIDYVIEILNRYQLCRRLCFSKKKRTDTLRKYFPSVLSDDKNVLFSIFYVPSGGEEQFCTRIYFCPSFFSPLPRVHVIVISGRVKLRRKVSPGPRCGPDISSDPAYYIYEGSLVFRKCRENYRSNYLLEQKQRVYYARFFAISVKIIVSVRNSEKGRRAECTHQSAIVENWLDKIA